MTVSGDSHSRLGNPSKDRRRFVDTIVLIAAPDWSKRLSNFENIIEGQFESVFECQIQPGFSKLHMEIYELSYRALTDGITQAVVINSYIYRFFLRKRRLHNFVMPKQ